MQRNKEPRTGIELDLGQITSTPASAGLPICRFLERRGRLYDQRRPEFFHGDMYY